MNEFTDVEQQRVAAALDRVGAKLPCPRCANTSFSLIPGYASFQLLPDLNHLGDVVIGGASLPVVIVVCTRCGFLSQHALGSLGLLPPPPSPQGHDPQT
jgi:hypothetical protein